VPKLRKILGKIISRVENLSLSAPYFRLLQWHLSAPYRLAPRAVAQLDRPLSPVLNVEICV